MYQLINYSSFILFILFAFMRFTQGQECTAGDCIEGYGHYIYKDGSKYMGMFEAGKKSGEGMNIYADGSTPIYVVKPPARIDASNTRFIICTRFSIYFLLLIFYHFISLPGFFLDFL